MPDPQDPTTLVTPTNGIIATVVTGLMTAIGALWYKDKTNGEEKNVRIDKLEKHVEECEQRHDVVAERLYRLEGRIEQMESKR